MAYYSQDQKKQIAPAVQALLKKHGLKGSLSVRHSSTVTLTITSGPFSFLDGNKGWPWQRISKNDFHIHGKGKAERGEWEKFVNITEQLYSIMDEGNHDRSDLMTDYFDVGWYITIQTGKWNKPFIATEA
jgi:hypothetical protein